MEGVFSMGQTKVKILGGLVALVLILSPTFAPQASLGAFIDFEGLPEGSIVSSLSFGAGISGDPISGEVTVFGINPVFGPNVNAAMIFDSACLPGGTPADCTGNDSDLFLPAEGNVLIISEDLDSNDPDDADMVGSIF